MRSRSLLLLRNGIFYVAALTVSAAFLPTTLLAFLPQRQLGRVGPPIVAAYLRSILFLLKRLCGLSFRLVRRDRLPDGPVLLASAHQTTWENLFFQIIFENPATVIKEEIFSYPVVGSVARMHEHIPAHRSGDVARVKASFEDVRRQARAGRSILIFPAGTRTGLARGVPLRRGVAALYDQLGLPCVPVAHNAALYWQFASWLRHPGTITVEILEPLPPGLNKKTFLKSLADRLNEATDRLLSSAPAPAMPARGRHETEIGQSQFPAMDG